VLIRPKPLAHVAQTLGIELSHAAAVGDGLNDLEMLKEVGLGIAMGNASEAVKSVARVGLRERTTKKASHKRLQRLVSERLV